MILRRDSISIFFYLTFFSVDRHSILDNVGWLVGFFFYSGPMGPLIVYLFFYNILLYLYCTTISHKIYDIHKIINIHTIDISD